MTVKVSVNVEQFQVTDLFGLAEQVGCPIKNKNLKNVCQWLIRQYGWSLYDRISRFIQEQAENMKLESSVS